MARPIDTESSQFEVLLLLLTDIMKVDAPPMDKDLKKARRFNKCLNLCVEDGAGFTSLQWES